MPAHSDPHDLQRFLDAQEQDYPRALAELTHGRKTSHWIWYVFPQYDGLGMSSTSRRYAIKSLDEAKAYLAHPVLGSRLNACLTALLTHEGVPIEDIMGYPDDLKLRSCVTLFLQIDPDNALLQRTLNVFFHGHQDTATRKLLGVV